MRIRTTTAAALCQKWNGHGREKRELKTAQMYCEIQLGQVLGPNPGRGTRTDKQPPACGKLNLPDQRAAELRRFYGWRDQLVDVVREGKVAHVSNNSGENEWYTPRLSFPDMSGFFRSGCAVPHGG